MRLTSWSSSKFADWIRGTVQPAAGTTKEWAIWEKTARKKSIRYWLAEDVLDFLEDLFYWPVNRIRAVNGYINNRWITKSHSLTSTLKKGDWYDFDTRLLHTAFDELVNFVEIEQAWMHVICCEEECKKFHIPWYRTKLRFGTWRCPEAGIAYLEWASQLKNDEEWMDKNSSSYNQPTHQALAAQETMALYHWWKFERPRRPDPHETSGWSDYFEKLRAAAKARGEESLFPEFNQDLTADEKSYRDKLFDKLHQIETEYDDEDTAMLIRLIKIRHSLWT